jgi:hypothetical protein
VVCPREPRKPPFGAGSWLDHGIIPKWSSPILGRWGRLRELSIWAKDWEHHPEGAALSRYTLYFQGSTVLIHYLLGDEKAETSPLGAFGGHGFHKELVPYLFGYTGARIPHLQDCFATFPERTPHSHFMGVLTGLGLTCLYGIGHEVHEDAVDAHGIHQNGPRGFC